MRNALIALSLAALLAGCAGQTLSPAETQTASAAAPAVNSPAAPSDPLSKLAEFSLADLQGASADAHAQNDETAYRCWDYLASVIPTIKLPNGQQTVGFFVAFQKARDLAKGTTSGWLVQFNLACAPLATDVRLTLAKFGLIAAGTAATGGALAPALPGLGALGATLPIPLP